MGPSNHVESVDLARQRVSDLLGRLAAMGGHSESAAVESALVELQEVVEVLETRFGLLRDILDRTDEIVFAKHADGRYAMLNPRGAAALGERVEDVLGKDDRALFSVADATRLMAIDADVMRSGEPTAHEEVCEVGGQPLHLIVTTTAWRGEGRKIRGVIGIAQDVTESRRSERRYAGELEALRGFATESVLREERLRQALAIELQSGLGQEIALAKLQLARLRKSVGAEFKEPLSAIERLVEQAERSLRLITFQISPPSLHDLGLCAALEWLAEELERKFELKVKLEGRGAPATLDDRVALIVFRAVRELLLNVATHSGVREAKVRIVQVDETLRVTVEDAGRGFDVLDAELRGYGLFGIGEQLKALGGTIAVESSAAKGTLVTLTAPILLEHSVLVRDSTH